MEASEKTKNHIDYTQSMKSGGRVVSREQPKGTT